ncbi:hypothetical protein EG834_00680 [bacterium]|nr:hypothetical protein [bacterium]
MKTLIRIGAFLWVSILFTGCGIGGFWMNGNPFLTPIKPYLHYWEKPGMTVEGRREDGTACGGGAQEAYIPSFTDEQERLARLPGEKDNFTVRARLFHNWERCMLKKGYRFTGKCYDNEISRSKSSCGAP